MTTEERFDRLERVVAGLAEERRKDREEFRQLWRDTQVQINDVSRRLGDLTLRLAETNATIDRLAEESRRMGEEFREADRRLSERIDTLVSSFGDFIRRLGEART